MGQYKYAFSWLKGLGFGVYKEYEAIIILIGCFAFSYGLEKHACGTYWFGKEY
jgi:hypothetical protein